MIADLIHAYTVFMVVGVVSTLGTVAMWNLFRKVVA